jgi:hypothetical protein
MQGLNPTYIAEVREKILDEFRDWGIDAGIFDENVEIYDVNYLFDKEPEDKDAGRLWYLGRSIQTMELADFVIFHKDWSTAAGCCVEHRVASEYFGNRIQQTCDRSNNVLYLDDVKAFGNITHRIDDVFFNRKY